MRTKKQVTVNVDVLQCDFCDNAYYIDLTHRQRQELGLNKTHYIGGCAICNKDCCDNHIGQATEDGQLCIDCSQEYEIAYAAEGGVGIKNKKNGKWLKDENL